MMATAIAHDDVTGESNDVWARTGLGVPRALGPPQQRRLVHVQVLGGVSSHGFQYGDITVPPGTKRLVVVLTWDEPARERGREPGRHV